MADTELKSGTSSSTANIRRGTKLPFYNMVIEAIKNSDDKKGASLHFIKSYIAETYKTVDPDRMKPKIRKAIIKGLDLNNIVRPKMSESMTGANGRFKLSKDFRKEEVLAAKKKELAASKTSKDEGKTKLNNKPVRKPKDECDKDSTNVTVKKKSVTKQTVLATITNTSAPSMKKSEAPIKPKASAKKKLIAEEEKVAETFIEKVTKSTVTKKVKTKEIDKKKNMPKKKISNDVIKTTISPKAKRKPPIKRV